MGSSEQCKPGRKERERRRHRREVLEAAASVFARKGFHEARMEEIAEEAEFGVGTIYNFFESKEKLYKEVVADITTGFMADLKKEVLTKEIAKDAIDALFEIKMKYFNKYRDFMRILLEASAESQHEFARSLFKSAWENHKLYIDAVSKIFQTAMEEGWLPRQDPLFLTLTMESLTRGIMLYWTLTRPSEPLGAEMLKLKNTFVEWARAAAAVASTS